MRPIRSFIPLSFISLIGMLFSCANRVTPTGGAADSRPPVILETFPDSGATGFSGDKVVITFDEFVQLKNPEDAIAVSPPIEPAPRAQVQRKSVVLEFPDSLQANTTYTIDFGDAIADLNEGNALRGYRFVFSTGPVIDTLSLRGRIIDALTLKPVAGALAVVFPAGIADSLLPVTKPSYFGRSGDDGTFNISNMREGSYRVFGLDDKNGNLRANLPDEKLGFLNEDISPSGQSVELKVSSHIPVKQNVLGVSLEEPGRLVVNFAKPLGKYDLKFIGTAPEKVYPRTNARGDTLTIVFVPRSDSAQVEISEPGLFRDTVRARISKGSNAAIASERFMSWTGTPSMGSSLIPGATPSIHWRVPLAVTDTGKMIMYRDTAQMTVNINTDPSGLMTSFEGNYTEGRYIMMLLPGAVSDVFGRSNDTVRFAFEVPAERSRGSLVVTTNASDKSRILQLVTEKDEVYRETVMPSSGKATIEGIDPGVYKARIIADDNSNGYWDAGDFRSDRQPEQVLIYPQPITVRANWEMEVVWGQ